MTSTVMQQRLGATITGTGEQVILLSNGLGTTQATWRYIVDALKHRARIIRYDNVCSPVAPPGNYHAEVYNSLFAYVDDVVALLDEFDVRDVMLVGHSIGGIIGMLAAVAVPERIAKLAVICSTPRYLADVDFRPGFARSQIDEILAAAQHDYAAWAAGFSAAATGPHASPADTAEVCAVLSNMRTDIALRTLQLVFFGDHRAMLPRVTQPVCVMHSREDQMVPALAGEFLVHHLPNAHLVRLESPGHIPHLTTPAAIVQALEQFLDRPA